MRVCVCLLCTYGYPVAGVESSVASITYQDWGGHVEWFGCGLAVSKTTTDAVPQRSAHAKNGEFQDCEELVFGLWIARLCFPILLLPLLAPRVAFFP